MEEMLKDEAGKYEKSSIRFTEHGYPLLPHKKMEDFSYILETVARHRNREYFIFKSIILNNLYGVDIMEEAVEICKLRLLLKLAAQVDPDHRKPNFGIEPLPDIDFNIRAGNTLVGFARYKDVENVVKSKLDFDNAKEKITTKAADLQQAFDRFREFQTEGDGTVPPEHKKEIQERLKALEEELNHYLAGEYGVDAKREKDYAHWLKTHQPFHWFIEFYGIVHEKGGFDVIIGNPPYVEYSKVKSQYTIKGYQTESCGNLYAFVVERAMVLLNDKGLMGVITPISLPSTPRMSQLRDLLVSKSVKIWDSNYSDRPGTLFNGVHQKLSIILMKKGDKKMNATSLFVTRYCHWYSNKDSNERHYLMNYIKYTLMPNGFGAVWFKYSDTIEYNIFYKIKSKKISLILYLNGHSTNFSLALRMMYWSKCFIDKKSKEYKEFFVNSKEERDVLVSVLNSTLYFWFWETLSDGWHITNKELQYFFIDIKNMLQNDKSKLSNLVEILMNDLENKKRYVGTVQTDYEYYHKLSKPIIDEIDCVLARHYGFTEEELDFIVNYDIKYRMGIGGDDGSDG